jgi:hypothetical protein
MIEETQLAFFALLATTATSIAKDPKGAVEGSFGMLSKISGIFGIGSDPDKVPDTATEEKFGVFLAQVSSLFVQGNITPEQAAAIIQQGDAKEAATLQAFLRDESRAVWNRQPGGPGFIWNRQKNSNPGGTTEQSRQGLIAIANSQSLGFVSNIPVVGDLIQEVTSGKASAIALPAAGGVGGWFVSGGNPIGAAVGAIGGWFLGRKK